MLSILLPARRSLIASYNTRITSYINQQTHNARAMESTKKLAIADDELIFEPRAQSSVDIIFQLNVCCHASQSPERNNEKSIIADSERFVELAGFGERFLSPARVHTHTNTPVWSASLSSGIVCFGNFPRHN